VHESLREFLSSGQRKIDKWYAALKVIEVAFDDEPDAFLNINTREELAGLEPRGDAALGRWER
jgi:molybdopterin-guanine dinucleotide biosynthesis protein A